MAQWGLAMTEWRPFRDGLPEDRRKAGIAEIDKATALHPNSDRERRYIGALSGYLHSDPAQNAMAVGRYAHAVGTLYVAHPNDVEAQAFYGLALSAAAALDPKDPIAADRKALAVLVPGFDSHPDHPGFGHYIIHTCDNPQLARKALPAAEKYAAIAPASAHALHMPGHIFARLGMWRQDITANLNSVNASELAVKEHLDGVAHEMHAYEFLLYAFLQDGDDAHARKICEYIDPLIRRLAAIPGIQNDGMYVFASYVQVEFPSIFHLERHEWKDVLAIALASMCPHGRHSLVGSDVTFNVSKIILDSSSQFHIGRTDLRTTPVAQSAFWDTPDLGEFLGADELPATTSFRGFNPARWQLERKDDPRGVDVGRLAAIIPSCSVCPRLKQNSISHVAPYFAAAKFPQGW
jgi:hypothetical protein